MDSPSLPPPPMASATTTAIANQANYPDSTNSSPRSHQNDTWDEPLPPVPGTKLRLMCSYGGHIIPSPYDKSLCYIGGDTRIIVVDRYLSLSEFHSRLSHSLLNGRAFMLKYQLPSEDLDSLVSVTNDEDLENMIDEYERINSTSPLKPSRVRLFLFPYRPDTAVSMGRLLDDAKSETWFVDALNDTGLPLPRGLSDSAAADNLLELNDPEVNRDSSAADVEHQNDGQILPKTVLPPPPDVHTTQSDSPVLETNLSFESSHSSPSISNLPPIKVRIEQSNQRILFYEQFSQMNVGTNAQKQDDGSINMATAPPPIPTFALPTAANSAAIGLRKPPLPLHPVQLKVGDVNNLPSPDSKHSGGYNLPSPDSVASDSSIASAASTAKYANYSDGNPTANTETKASDSVTEPQNNIPAPSSHVQFQLVHDTTAPPFAQQNQQQQQQLVQPTVHYIQHTGTNNPQQISSYYPMYAPHPSQAFHQTHDQQYPMYLLPATQTQPYHLTVQPNIPETPSTASNQPSIPANPSIIPSSVTYNEIGPPIYPVNPSNYYRQAVTTNPALVHVPSAQFQQQYFSHSQMQQQQQPPAQSFPDNSCSTPGYGFEYAHPMNDQGYYGQHFTTSIPQYQTMTTTPAATMMFTQNATNSAAENLDQQAGNPQ